MLIHESDQEDLQVYTSVSDRMGRFQSRSRYFNSYHPLIRRYLVLLVPICLISTIFFSTIFYFNITRVYRLYSNVYLPTQSQISVQQAVENVDILPRNRKKERGLTTYDENITYKDFNYLDSDTLTYENRTYLNDIHILFRLPMKRNITALLLIFHGCGRSAYEWFHTIERQRIIGAAIDLGYGCLAFQTTEEHSGCWSGSTDVSNNRDAQMVLKGLEKFYEEYPKLESLPRFTFGASSGGIFSSIFVTNQRYKIQGQILFISIIDPDILEVHVKAKSYPPTAWIYMLRDIEFASEDRINASMQVFIKEKIPYIGFDIEPIRLTPRTFHDRIPTITHDASHYIFYRLQQNKWLNAQNYLIYNPRREDAWKTFLFTSTNKQTEGIRKNLEKHEKILPDFFNTIYGEHEISFERSFEALKWHRRVYNSRIDSTQ